MTIKTTCHRDGSITFFGTFHAQWHERVRSIRDEELSAMNDKDRDRVILHLDLFDEPQRMTLHQLREEAERVRDTKQIDLCRRALDGNRRALLACARAIAAASDF